MGLFFGDRRSTLRPIAHDTTPIHQVAKSPIVMRSLSDHRHRANRAMLGGIGAHSADLRPRTPLARRALRWPVLHRRHEHRRLLFCLKVRFPDPRAVLSIVERVRRLFDLGADPAVIGEHLGADPLLRGPLARHPGIRMPGAWDGFELAVRAILGQQISVRAATTLAGRIASMFGRAEAASGEGGRLFPTPARLADAAIGRAGVMPARAEAIRTLARRVVDGRIAFGPCIDGRAAIAALSALPGVGEWTAEYIAMRALGDEATLRGLRMTDRSDPMADDLTTLLELNRAYIRFVQTLRRPAIQGDPGRRLPLLQSRRIPRRSREVPRAVGAAGRDLASCRARRQRANHG
jgi:endonuclease III